MERTKQDGGMDKGKVKNGSMCRKSSFVQRGYKKRDKGTVQGTRGRFYCLVDIEEQKFRLGDNDAKELIKKLSGCNKMSELQLLEIARRDEYIKKLRKHGS